MDSRKQHISTTSNTTTSQATSDGAISTKTTWTQSQTGRLSRRNQRKRKHLDQCLHSHKKSLTPTDSTCAAPNRLQKFLGAMKIMFEKSLRNIAHSVNYSRILLFGLEREPENFSRPRVSFGGWGLYTPRRGSTHHAHIIPRPNVRTYTRTLVYPHHARMIQSPTDTTPVVPQLAYTHTYHACSTKNRCIRGPRLG